MRGRVAPLFLAILLFLLPFASAGHAVLERDVFYLLEPFEGFMPGTHGIPFRFGIGEPCRLPRAFSVDGRAYYAAPSTLSRASFLGFPAIAEGDMLGVYRDERTGEVGWFVDNSRFNGATPHCALWERLMTEEEARKVRYLDER